MYNPEYIAYMNEQIKKALNKERKEFLDDMECIADEDDLWKTRQKWEKRLKE